MADRNDSTEITLYSGEYSLTVSAFGAAIRGMRKSGKVIITEFSSPEEQYPGQGDVLMPWPGRIPEGFYMFQGQPCQLPTSANPHKNAIHGLFRNVPWEIEAYDDSSVTFSLSVEKDDFRGYPFSLRSQVRYTLSNSGLRCEFHTENTGDNPAPFGAGFHPYFTAGSEKIDSDSAEIPMESMQIGNTSEPVSGSPADFQSLTPIQNRVLDAVYTGARRDSQGIFRARYLSDQREITVWMDESFPYLVVYSGETLPEPYSRRSLAIEPWTCAPDAFNHPERGLIILNPGDTASGTWGVSAEIRPGTKI